MLNYRFWIVGLVIALLLLPTAFAGAAKNRIVIEKMGSGGLDRLLQDPNNPRMVIAMAAWCGPCRKELPTLIKLFEKYEDKGLKMVGISVDANGPEALQKILDKARVNFPVYWVGVDIAHEYNIYAIPMIFFIKDGQVIEKLPGQRAEKFLDKRIQNLLK
jgi:thiol-disulfide isomerase/thioredoxin